jgi:hypothetical protein
MVPVKAPSRWKWKSSEMRMLTYLLVLLGVAAWKFMPRPWHPAITFNGPHHTIYSSATPSHTYVRRLKAAFDGTRLELPKSGSARERTNSAPKL